MPLKEDSLGMMIDQVRMLLIKKKNSRLLEYAFHKVAMSFVNTCFWAKKDLKMMFRDVLDRKGTFLDPYRL